jgi:hypothetical protein
LNIFYTLALTHAFIFLIEKAYWIWTVSYLKIIEKVCKECGLEILTNLAGNPMNCLKITEKTVLVSQVVDFTRFIVCPLDIKDKVKFTMVKKSLMLLKKIISTNGKPGQIIRREISEISSIVNNFRNILKYGGKESVLFITVIEILTALSMDKGAHKKIGSTNGISGLFKQASQAEPQITQTRANSYMSRANSSQHD